MQAITIASLFFIFSLSTYAHPDTDTLNYAHKRYSHTINLMDSTKTMPGMVFAPSKTYGRETVHYPTFNPVLNLSNAIFDSAVHFSRSLAPTTFNASASFSQATFHSVAQFDYMVSHAPVNFSEATFHDQTSFNSAHLVGPIVFDKAQFLNRFNFQLIMLKAPASFRNVVFHGDVNIWGIFTKAAFFNGAEFRVMPSFFKTSFSGFADFSGAVFHDGAYLERTILPDTLNFADVTVLKGEVDFSKARLSRYVETCFINLLGTNLDNIKFKDETFTLYFPPDTPSEKKAEVYSAVLHKFRREGLTKSHALVLKEYQALQVSQDD